MIWFSAPPIQVLHQTVSHSRQYLLWKNAMAIQNAVHTTSFFKPTHHDYYLHHYQKKLGSVEEIQVNGMSQVDSVTIDDKEQDVMIGIKLFEEMTSRLQKDVQLLIVS